MKKNLDSELEIEIQKMNEDSDKNILFFHMLTYSRRIYRRELRCYKVEVSGRSIV